MLTLRKSEERGRTRIDWLDSYHTFSFGDYHDPGYMGFSDLRVINDDYVRPNSGFGTHGHRDMEIITVVLEGELEHKDSLGNGSIIRPGDVQRMTAGTGVQHSEYNPSTTQSVHLLQIWIFPEVKGLEPSYEQRSYPLEEQQGKWRLLASRNGKEGSVTIHQDVLLYSTILKDEETVQYQLNPERLGWLHVATGAVKIEGMLLKAGDSGSLSLSQTVDITGQQDNTQVLLFDLGK